MDILYLNTLPATYLLNSALSRKVAQDLNYFQKIAKLLRFSYYDE